METNKQLRELYETDANFRAFGDWAATFKRNPRETAVDHAAYTLNFSRNDASIVLKKLCGLGLASWVVGRHGAKTRAVWEHAISDIGRAMRGDELIVLEEEPGALTLDNPSYTSDRHANGSSKSPVAASVNDAKLQAKELISRVCGVPPENVEITIKF